MVEATAALLTTNDISLEGFLMHNFVIDSNVKLIPAHQLHKVNNNSPRIGNKNTKSKWPLTPKSVKSKRTNVSSECQTRQSSSVKMNAKLRGVSVCLEKSSSWVSKLTNAQEINEICSISSADLKILNGKKCVAGERKDISVGNQEHENKKLKLADAVKQMIDESAKRLSLETKKQMTRSVTKKAQIKDTESTEDVDMPTTPHSKRKEQSLQNTHKNKGRTRNGSERSKQDGYATRNRRTDKAPSNESKVSLNHSELKARGKKRNTKSSKEIKQPEWPESKTTNKKRENLINSPQDSLLESINQDCNSSMLLRSHRLYYGYLQVSDDDEMDETWEEVARKRKKARSKRNPQKMNETAHEKLEKKPKETKKEKADKKVEKQSQGRTKKEKEDKKVEKQPQERTKKEKADKKVEKQPRERTKKGKSR